MDGGRSQGAGSDEAGSQWRSTIPGVSQRDGAPATVGLAAWGLGHGGAQASAQGRAGSAGECPDGGGRRGGGLRGFGEGGPARDRRRLPWRAITLAGLALAAILGVARVAGADVPGVGGGWEQAGWDVAVGGVAGTAEPDVPGRPAPGGGHESAPTGEPEAGPPPTPSAAPEAPGGGPSAGPPDWWEVLAELDRRRARALSVLDPELVSDYATPESAAWSADTGLVAGLRARGLKPQGLGSRVVAVERAERGRGLVRLQIVDRRSAYSLVDSHGDVVESVPAAGLTRWSVTLAQEPDDPVGWRIVDAVEVRPDAGGPSGGAPP